MLTTTSGAVTDTGLVRDANEDSVLVTARLVAVADGLGGHAAGEIASRLAVDRLGELARLASTRPLEPPDVLAAIAAANRAIVESARHHAEYAGMGTTLCGACVVEVEGVEHVLVFNVGDSRVYRQADGTLTQVTVDHSEVEELRAAGQLSAEAAAHHPRRNVITRCLGTLPAPVADTWLILPAGPERYLACSDGLTGEVDDAVIARLLTTHPEPETAAKALVQEALAKGGHDNVTAAVLDLRVDGAEAAREGES